MVGCGKSCTLGCPSCAGSQTPEEYARSSEEGWRRGCQWRVGKSLEVLLSHPWEEGKEGGMGIQNWSDFRATDTIPTCKTTPPPHPAGCGGAVL